MDEIDEEKEKLIQIVKECNDINIILFIQSMMIELESK